MLTGEGGVRRWQGRQVLVSENFSVGVVFQCCLAADCTGSWSVPIYLVFLMFVRLSASLSVDAFITFARWHHYQLWCSTNNLLQGARFIVSVYRAIHLSICLFRCFYDNQWNLSSSTCSSSYVDIDSRTTELFVVCRIGTELTESPQCDTERRHTLDLTTCLLLSTNRVALSWCSKHSVNLQSSVAVKDSLFVCLADLPVQQSVLASLSYSYIRASCDQGLQWGKEVPA